MRALNTLQGSTCSYTPFADSSRLRKDSTIKKSSIRCYSSSSSYFGERVLVQVKGAVGHSRSRQEWDRKCQIIRAAIFGVGAPEALLVGVVALVVFGPKGLAQAVKSLGATLRTFSPTIRELASVTNDLSSTLQEQIGLDDIRNEFRNPPPNYYRNSDKDWETASSSDSEKGEAPKAEAADASELETEDLEAKIAESKRMAWGSQEPQASSQTESQDAAPPNLQPPESEASSAKKASELSIDELEAELKRRRASANSAKL